MDPARAEPSQSRMARRVSTMTLGGRLLYRVSAIAWARRRVTASGFEGEGGIAPAEYAQMLPHAERKGAQRLGATLSPQRRCHP